MKRCAICKTELEESLFSKDRSRKDGLSAKCKPCAKSIIQKRKDKDPELFREKSRDSMRKHRSQLSESERLSTWRRQRADRRAAINKAKPKWLTGSQKAHIKRTYRLAQIISEETNKKYHVDHIIPLRGDNICGLHVPWNLRVIPAESNLQKGNSY